MQDYFHINLQDTIFPMLTGEQSLTVINPVRGEVQEPPSVSYMHNVVPTDSGYKSISFSEEVPAGGVTGIHVFEDIREMYGSKLRIKIYIGFSDETEPFILFPPTNTWASIPTPNPPISETYTTSNRITVATVNGISYIHFTGRGTYTFDDTTKALVNVTLSGLDLSSVLGLVSSSGYLVAYNQSGYANSSTLDPTDFVPSQITGAGGGNIEDIAGKILYATSNSFGMIFYAEQNAVGASYTGNIQFPWKFKEIPGSKGGISLDLTGYEANSDDDFIYSDAGLQVINNRRAETILPAVTDFLSGSVLEDFNESTGLFEITGFVNGTFNKKINFINSRYLVISYGVSFFTHALIFDRVLNKLGKLKVTHIDCFEWDISQFEVPREVIGFLQADGTVLVVDFGISIESSGVLILGKLAHSRSKFITLLDVELVSKGNITGGSNALAVSTQASLDGVTFATVPGSVAYDSADADSFRNVTKYAFKSTAKNHSILLQGFFNLSSLVVTYETAGDR